MGLLYHGLQLVSESPEPAAFRLGAEDWRGDWSGWAHPKFNLILAALQPHSTKFALGTAAPQS
jgi:hypothetical protein